VFVAALAGAVLVPAGPALAHGGDQPDATAYRIEVTGIGRELPGLSVRVVEAGARLELTNATGHSVEVLGYQGEPYLDVRPDGTYRNANSPATYLNETIGGDSPVPSNADPTAAPDWRKISTGTTVRWHDQRPRWNSDGLAPQAVADPGRAHKLRDWSVPLRTGATTFTVEGTLTWEPPPLAWAWWAGTAALAATIFWIGQRRPRLVGPVTLVAGTITIAYATTRLILGVEGQLPALVSGLLAVGAGVLTLRGRGPFPLLLAGAAMAIFAGANEAGVFTQAVVNFPGPGWLPRLAVLTGVGAGAGLAAIGVMRVRAETPATVGA
jgi:hypothetical protein